MLTERNGKRKMPSTKKEVRKKDSILEFPSEPFPSLVSGSSWDLSTSNNSVIFIDVHLHIFFRSFSIEKLKISIKNLNMIDD